MKISLYTFGCKLNQAESNELKKDLLKRGFSIVPIDSGERIAIVRACAVTTGASRSTREMIRYLKRSGAFVIAVGCLENIKLPELDYAAKNNEEILAYLKDNFSAEFDRDAADMEKNRTRAFIKIQTGCNFNCSYCIIPTFRGRSNSVEEKDIITAIKEAEMDGFKEVILTGVNICQYKDPNSKNNLTDLLKNILNKTEIPRIRLGSLDPRLVTNELVELYNNTKIHKQRLLPHWHLSLQSGSNDILKKMNRLYTTTQYKKIVEKLRMSNPDFSFTTDIIVGFPGETDKDFNDTCELAKEIIFSKIHIFPYSPRPNTEASKLKTQIKDAVKKDRTKKLKLITDKCAKDFSKKFQQKKSSVLFEKKKTSSNVWEGYTPEYLRVKIKFEKNLENTIMDIENVGLYIS